jgi:hypothetical protein
MTQMTNAQARVIDPILTNLALGYSNAAFVGEALFPRVYVGQRAGKIIVFDRNDYRLYNSRRAPGANVETVDVGYGSGSYALEDHNLDGKVPIENMQEAAAVPNINLQRRAVRKVQRALGTRLEVDQGNLARASGAYGSQLITYNGSTSWKNSAATPLVDVATARQVILAATGVYPNTLLMSDTAFDALRFHASITDRLKYTSARSVTTETLAELFQVEKIVVGAGTYIDENGAAQKIWGNDAILAYVAQGSSLEADGDNSEPSFGYTYTLRGYPNAENPWWDGNVKSWRVPYNDVRAPLLTGLASGYLFQNAGQ